MAVFTPVTLEDVGHWISQFPLGKAVALKGIASGIENSNFFLTTERGEYVLTIFENLTFEQLPFYLQLMRHLAEHGVLVPAPVPNDTGELCVPLHGKPAAIVSKLEGKPQMAPQPVHCAAVGGMLARMHMAGADFTLQQPNLRALPWWREATAAVLPHIALEQAHLLHEEMKFQEALHASAEFHALQRGPVHAVIDGGNRVEQHQRGAVDHGTDHLPGVVIERRRGDQHRHAGSGKHRSGQMTVSIEPFAAIHPESSVCVFGQRAFWHESRR